MTGQDEAGAGNGYSGLEIAIVGLACRYPGADSPKAFWDNLLAGRESVSFPSDEALILAGCDVEELLRPDFVRSSGALAEPFAFDSGFFRVADAEADVMDPQHRLFLTCCWEALEDAGYPPDGTTVPVGVFAGAMANTYHGHYVFPNRERIAWLGAPLIALSNQATYLPNRVSYKLNLTGPSLSVNTACSTSLVAVHVACKALLAGECDMALAGAAAISFPHGMGFRTFGETAGAVSSDGHCRPFDQAAGGMVPGAGVGVALLKRLEDAIADRDHVYAVIRGTAVNNDGHHKVGFLAPSFTGQREVILQAMAAAEIDSTDLNFVEAHGTATPLGDPIEVQALAEALDRPDRQACALVSTKANIGHSQEAAGLAGLIKSAFALQQRQLPPQINFTAPGAELHLDKTPFFVPTTTHRWPRSAGTLRAGISSFGLGGTNAHAVLESPPMLAEAPSGLPVALYPVSARTAPQLASALRRLADHLVGLPPQRLADAAYTLQVGRKGFPFRRTIVARPAEAAERLRRAASAVAIDGGVPAASAAPVALVVPASLRMSPGLLCRLLGADPHVRDVWNSALEAAAPATRLEATAWLDGQDARVPAGVETAAGYALGRRWQGWGLTPDLIAGFGAGRWAAAALAHAVPLRAAMAGACTPGDALAPRYPLLLGGGIETSAESVLHGLSGPDAAASPDAIRMLREHAAVRICVDGGAIPGAAGATLEAGRGDDDLLEHLLALLGRAWEGGAAIDWAALSKGDTHYRLPLPTYPFEPRRHVLKRPPARSQPVPAVAKAPRPSPATEAAQGDAEVREILHMRIGGLWSEILGADQIDGQSNFIALGGDSLHVFRLAGALREMFEIHLEIRALFEASTLGEQVLLVEQALLARIEDEPAEPAA